MATAVKLPRDGFEVSADADHGFARFIAEYGIRAQDHLDPIMPTPAVPLSVSVNNPTASTSNSDPSPAAPPKEKDSEKETRALVKPCWNLWTECGRHPNNEY